jgi:N-acetyltransferase
MAIVSAPDTPSSSSSTLSSNASVRLIPIHIDPSTSLHVHPAPLPTALGVSRLFVAASHRRHGVARALLDAAAATFVHGCALDPARGDVAFSQPTLQGRAVMLAWGGSGVRIYEE